MSSFLIYAVTGVILFGIALYGALARQHLLRKIMALNIMGSGIFLLLVSVARRNLIDVPDPVPHAMVLTGIVVTLAMTAFAISLARRIYDSSGRMSIHDREDAE
jgi:multicomponent Na+:H+ antiporter subunit C